MIPVLLLTGFLGSGKTTLLNGLLDSRPAEGPFSEGEGTLAVIVNEFGDIGIDGDLLPSDLTKQIEIQGGCICCKLDGDLENTIRELLVSEQKVQAIVIETTGIAEPVPISWTLASENLAKDLRLAAIVTVVDAKEHMQHRTLGPTVDLQVDAADIVALTKTDIASRAEIAATLESVRGQNTFAPILGQGAEQAMPLAKEIWTALDDPDLESQKPPAKSGSASRSHGFESVSLEISGVLDLEVLVEELESLGPNYVRIKGIAPIVDPSSGSSVVQMAAFHRVGARVSAEALQPAAQPMNAKHRIVAIGMKLDKNELGACIGHAMLES